MPIAEVNEWKYTSLLSDIIVYFYKYGIAHDRPNVGMKMIQWMRQTDKQSMNIIGNNDVAIV